MPSCASSSRRVHQQSLECSALDSCTHAHAEHCARAKLARRFHPARARHAGDDPAPPDPVRGPEQELQLQEQTTEKQEKQARLQKDLERGNTFSKVRIC